MEGFCQVPRCENMREKSIYLITLLDHRVIGNRYYWPRTLKTDSEKRANFIVEYAERNNIDYVAHELFFLTFDEETAEKMYLSIFSEISPFPCQHFKG